MVPDNNIELSPPFYFNGLENKKKTMFAVTQAYFLYYAVSNYVSVFLPSFKISGLEYNLN